MNVEALVELLRVEPAGNNVFVGNSPADRERPVYGGQLLGQALMAAAGTVEPDREPHSLHAYFVRSGAAKTPIRFTVEQVRDGRNFSHRSVVADQGGREIFRQTMSFQVPTAGLEHQEPLPITPGTDPSAFPRYREWVAELSDSTDHGWFSEQLPIDIRFEDPPATTPRQPMPGVHRIWIRLPERVASDDAALHAALLAWMSDKTISDVVMYPHGRSWTDVGTDILSLDHGMWFHAPARADEWTLFTHEAPATRGGRGLSRGDLVTLDGTRVGAVVQEALLLLEQE